MSYTHEVEINSTHLKLCKFPRNGRPCTYCDQRVLDNTTIGSLDLRETLGLILAALQYSNSSTTSLKINTGIISCDGKFSCQLIKVHPSMKCYMDITASKYILDSWVIASENITECTVDTYDRIMILMSCMVTSENYNTLLIKLTSIYVNSSLW